MEITATEAKKNFGKYLNLAAEGQEITITKNNKEYVRLTKAKKDPVEVLNSMVGSLTLEGLPSVGVDERLDHILGRDQDDSIKMKKQVK